MRFQNTILPLLPSLVAAVQPPNVDGMSIVWQDAFEGSAGSSPNTGKWNIMDAIDTNGEVQTYTTSSSNLQISGGGTIQFVPRRSGNGKWTSGRIESKASWTPSPGKVMSMRASILQGDNPTANKQGMWPAFWLLGDAIRHGTAWPLCGEIDIMEQVNGIPTAYGTVHCDQEFGGACNQPTGIGGIVGLPTEGFHTWGLTIDLTNPNWALQTMTWSLDGNTFFTLAGGALGSEGMWATLAHSPMYMILNVAVGGDWPGAPNAATLDSYGSMMEVAWAAVYSS
ncbi:glycoside hydrolase family 16 protein [Xylariomycetidae sp. FL0641]|nr:glycoside hydrolase family 16 protein [Xylariomycetidae sp. FL0641]